MSKPRKKISQREAMRMRKQLRELSDPYLSHGNKIFSGNFGGWAVMRSAIETATTCEHLVLCRCEGDAVTFFAYKP